MLVKVGATSLSLIVSVAFVIAPPVAAPETGDSVRPRVSVDSCIKSSMIGNAIVLSAESPSFQVAKRSPLKRPSDLKLTGVVV